MPPASPAHEFDEEDLSPTPFRAAFGRARTEALEASGAAGEPPRTDPAADRPAFEYRLVTRRGKRSAEETAWNELGRQGWELVGVTGKHAAFKRRVAVRAAVVSR